MNNKCCICQNNISNERIEGLQILGIAPQNYTCIVCASQAIKPYKAIYLNQSGISPLMICRDVGQEGIKKEENILKDEEENSID